MIRTLKLKFGSAPGHTPVCLDTAPVTVFVGPNNSGKSKVLQEINRRCTSGLPHQSDVILETLEFLEFPADQIPSIKKSLTLRPHKNETINPGRIIVGKHHRRHQVPEDQFDAALGNPNTQSQHFCQWYLALHTLMLDGKSRITLVDEQTATDLQQAPKNVLNNRAGFCSFFFTLRWRTVVEALGCIVSGSRARYASNPSSRHRCDCA